MAPKRDYYDVLEVERSASGEDIKRAFRRLAMQFHPDRNPSDAEAERRFKEATEAYSVLSDSEKRRRYDRLGHAAFGDGGGGQDPMNFGSVGEILEGFLGDLIGGLRRQRGGGDLEVEVSVSFEEAALGAEKLVDVERRVVCPDCDGSGAAPGSRVQRCPVCNGRGELRTQRGFFSVSRPCHHCGGSGRVIETPCRTCGGEGFVQRKEQLRVRLPPGVEDGSTRTVKGAGERGRRGAGDLHVRVRVETHPLFTRDGADIRVTVPLSFPQVVLGSQVEVPTLEGKVKMRIPAGTQSGKTFRLRGRGIPSMGGVGKGDELVRVVVEVPQRVSRKQRQLIADLAKEMGEDVHPQQKSFMDKLRALFE